MPKSSNNDPERNLAFPGFEPPSSNFFRMPNNWTDITADMKSMAEMKVVEYILRHTWGYQEYGIMKRITIGIVKLLVERDVTEALRRYESC